MFVFSYFLKSKRESWAGVYEAPGSRSKPNDPETRWRSRVVFVVALWGE